VGAGVGLNGAGNHDKNADALWNVGGGVAYNVTRNWQLDARYRYVDGWQGGREAEHAVSLGVNYKF
jgi:outer membrane autotransporter protein